MKTLEVFKRHFKYFHKCKKDYLYLYYALTMIVGGLLPFITLYLTRYIVDEIGVGDFNHILLNLLIIISILLVFTTINVFNNSICEGIFIKLRMNEFKNVAKLYKDMDFKYVEDSKFNDEFSQASSCLNSDGQGFQGLFHKMFLILPLLLSTIIYTIILGVFNIIILLLVLFSFIISLLIQNKLEKHYSNNINLNKKHYKHMSYFFNTSVDDKYGKDIRLFNMNKILNNKYKEEIDSIYKNTSKLKHKEFLLSLFDLLVVFVRDFLAYYLIIRSFTNNLITIGELTLYLGIILGLSQTLRRVSDIIPGITENVSELKEYFIFLDKYDFYSNNGSLKAIDKNIALEIEFKNVSFKYPGSDKLVLNNLSFKINAGEKLAIIGDNGAGKSTIIKLISGLYEPTSGEILVNGINKKEFDKYEYYSMFSTVFQDVNIYPGTILENVCGTDADNYSVNKAIDALNKVGLEEKIKSLPNGYNSDLTHVFEDEGIMLSGGESQKLCIARALYKDSNVVILDEPTSALDALAEASIYESFSTLVENKTAIYISHRLSSTKFCDHIALFTKDGLVEYGNHESLMSKKGLYYEMFMIQGKYYKVGDCNEE